MKSLDHVNNDSESPLYLIFINVDGYIIKESNRDKYLIFVSTNQNKKVLEKYTKRWNEIKIQIETINGGKLIKYKEHFTKIRFDSDNDLPLGKILNIPSLIIIARSVFKETTSIIIKFIYMNVCINLWRDYKNAATSKN